MAVRQRHGAAAAEGEPASDRPRKRTSCAYKHFKQLVLIHRARKMISFSLPLHYHLLATAGF
jgi:hypothetical protein